MGHRIELEEIEHSMNQIQGLEKSCCLMDYRKNQLVAFYLGEECRFIWFPIRSYQSAKCRLRRTGKRIGIISEAS